MFKVEIIGHFQKDKFFNLNFEDLKGFTWKNSKLMACRAFQELSKLYSYVSKLKKMSKFRRKEVDAFLLNFGISCKMQILDNLSYSHSFGF